MVQGGNVVICFSTPYKVLNKQVNPPHALLGTPCHVTLLLYEIERTLVLLLKNNPLFDIVLKNHYPGYDVVYDGCKLLNIHWPTSYKMAYSCNIYPVNPKSTLSMSYTTYVGLPFPLDTL